MSVKTGQHGVEVTDSVGLLISILVRYPEVGTVNFDPEKRTLRLSFMLNTALIDETWAAYYQHLTECLDAYAKLVKAYSPQVTVEQSQYDNFSLIEIRRDVETLIQEEISLIIAITRNWFGEQLVVDDQETGLPEEEMQVQEELINHLLDNIRQGVYDKSLIAFREEGRVVVFNK